MGRFRSSSVRVAVAILSLWCIVGCGSGSKAGPALYPGKVILTPASISSISLGATVGFTASVQTTSGTNLNVPVTYASSDTSILTLSPNGVACAGHWDNGFTTCIPAGTGPVTVTASALGASSEPTWVFVHSTIDNVTVNGILLDGVPVKEPCLSQTQSMTLEAHAFSQGIDVTSSVGPFTWTASNPSVVGLVPLVNSAYSFATNQVTATALNPGMTKIYATASGVTSTTFQQPQYQATVNGTTETSPVLDFFETCPIENISLEMRAAGSGQTSFTATKGSSTGATVVATLTDVMGNTSLPNTTGGIILSKIPLTWTSSQPGVVSPGTGCTNSCSLSLTSPGSATITASCSPPSCNVGFPLIPASLSSATQIAACTKFFQAESPQNFSCQELIPVPVYASPFFLIPPATEIPLNPPTGAVSGIISGTAAAASILAGSTGCANVIPTTCSTAVYYLSTAKASPGSENPLPDPPNSLLFDLAGDKIYAGSNFGAEIINPANFGTSNSAYTGLGTVTGKVLATSNSGTYAVYSDTIHTPNQVYVVNSTNASSLSASALTIPSGAVAAFSPDTLKALIAGGNNASSLWIYSQVQALQGPITLPGPANSIAFAPSGAFAYVATASTSTSSAELTAFASCNNQVAGTLPLPASPVLMQLLPNSHIDGKDSYGNSIPDGIHLLILDSTGFDIVTSTISAPAAGTLCPQGLNFISDDPLRKVQRIELGQGTLQPVNFFASGDGTQLYIVDSGTSSILVYNFITGSVVGGIELQNNATPVSAAMSVDGGFIIVAGSDGYLHEVSTALGGNDLVLISFPDLPNQMNAFCDFAPASGPCTFNTVLVKP